MSKARDLADLGAVTSRLDTVGASDGALSNRNAIINGEFSVSQRGDYTSATVMTDNAYIVDRWKTYRGAGSATFQDMGGSLKLVATSAYSGTLRIQQYVEWANLSTRVGNTFTLSAYMKTTSSNARLLVYTGTGWLTGTTTHSGSGDWERITFTFTMPDASSYGSVVVAVGIDGVDSANVSIANGESVEIKQVQLEVGDTATSFEHEDISVTRAKCLRYYEKSYDDPVAPATVTNYGVYWQNEVSNRYYDTLATLVFKVEKRAEPTMLFYPHTGTMTANHAFLERGTTSFTNTVHVWSRGLKGVNVYSSTGGQYTQCQMMFHWVADAEF